MVGRDGDACACACPASSFILEKCLVRQHGVGGWKHNTTIHGRPSLLHGMVIGRCIEKDDDQVAKIDTSVKH